MNRLAQLTGFDALARVLPQVGGTTAPGNGPDATRYYAELTIPSTGVSSTLTDFPVYVDLSTLPAEFWSNVQSDGGDIRVTEADGTTRCPVELVDVDSIGNTGELHFLASSLSSVSDTVFRIYYGASGLSQPAVTDLHGRNAVWSGYEAVYHLDQDPSGAVVDSTGNGHSLTSQGAMTSADLVAGRLGDGIEMDGTDDALSNADGFVGPQVISFSVWYKPARTPSSGTSDNVLSTDAAGANRWVNYKSDHTVTFQMWVGSGYGIPGTTPLPVGAWHHLHAQNGGSAGTVALFANGALEASAVGDDTSAIASRFNLGGFVTQNRDYAAGVYDEARVALTTRADAWVATEHANQDNPATFYSVGSQQAA